MKLELALIALLTLAGVGMFFQESQTATLSQTNLHQQYVQWKSIHGKNTNGKEDQYRFQVFAQNTEEIEKFNAENPKTTLAMNQFGDLTEEEFQATQLGIAPVELENKSQNTISSNASYPKSVNWANEGAVSPVVPNQGNCGSCWAFSTIGALEGLNKITNGQFTYLSQQQVVSCAPRPAFNGCRGSYDPFFAFEYTAENGVETAEEYPYVQGAPGKQKDIPCAYDKSKVVFQNNGNSTVEFPSSEQVYEIVAKQPASVLVNAGFAFQFYSSGVLLNSKCGGRVLNHAVLLAGYDSVAETPYFLVRNSWGATWGEKGYIKLEVTDTDAGTCGVKSVVSVPTL